MSHSCRWKLVQFAEAAVVAGWLATAFLVGGCGNGPTQASGASAGSGGGEPSGGEPSGGAAAGASPDSGGGRAGAGAEPSPTPLDLNDVSFLFPLPKWADRDDLLSPSSSGTRGELLPASAFNVDAQHIIVQQSDVVAPSDVHASLRVVGIRVDPCFPAEDDHRGLARALRGPELLTRPGRPRAERYPRPSFLRIFRHSERRGPENDQRKRRGRRDAFSLSKQTRERLGRSVLGGSRSLVTVLGALSVGAQTLLSLGGVARVGVALAEGDPARAQTRSRIADGLRREGKEQSATQERCPKTALHCAVSSSAPPTASVTLLLPLSSSSNAASVSVLP